MPDNADNATNQLSPREWASIERLSLKNITDKTPIDQVELVQFILTNLDDTNNCFNLVGLLSEWWENKPQEAKSEALQSHRDLIERLNITIEAADSLENVKNKNALKAMFGKYRQEIIAEIWDSEEKVAKSLNSFRKLKSKVRQILQS